MLRLARSSTFCNTLSIELLLLGSPELLVDGLPVQVDTRKAIAIVAMLAEDATASRDSIAAMLWPESDESRARSALRRTLSALRSALGDVSFSADRRQVILSDTVKSDVAEFRAALRAVKDHAHGQVDVCQGCMPVLEDAASLYRGDFLAGFSLRDAPAFEDWVRPLVERYRLDAGDVAERLSAGRASLGDYRGAIEAAKRWIELDSLHEPAYRNLMLLSAWAGDRAGAVEAYRSCVSVLSAELGVSPLEETTELYEAILDEDLPPAPGPRRRVRMESGPPVVPLGVELLGRDEELGVLASELERMADGPGVVVLTGNTWCGKTRVLEEAAAVAQGAGRRVLIARGYRSERSLPYGIAVQLLRAAQANDWYDEASLPTWVRAEVSRLLPELAPDGPRTEPLSESLLLEAVTFLVGRIATVSGLLVVIDDALWVDAASATMLSYARRRLGDAPVLFLLAMRADVSPLGAGAPEVEGLTADATIIVLDPLTADDLASSIPDPAARYDLIERTGGIPVLVAEYLGGARAEAPTGGVRRYVEAMLAGLDGLSQQVLAAAAAVDGVFDVHLLRSVSGRAETEVVDAVETLLRRRVLREVPGLGGFGFALDGIGAAVYSSLSPVRLRLLHGRAAQAFREMAGDPDAVRAATIARHVRLSGDDGAASTWYATAGHLAAEVFALSEAEASFREALALDHPDPTHLRLALGEVLLIGGRYSDALDVFQVAAATADGPDRSLAEHRIGEVHRRLGRFDLAEQHFRLAEAEHPDPSSLFADWALLRHRQGGGKHAVDLAERGVALANAAGDRRAESRARDILGIVADDASELEQALALAGDDPMLRMAALNSLAYAVAADDPTRALDAVEEALVLAGTVGDRHRQAALLNHLADLLHRLGRRPESEAALTEAVRLFADIQPDSWEPEVWLLTRW